MKITINITKWHFYVMIVLISLLILTTLVAAVYTTPIPSPGHGAESILVSDLNGAEKTLQEFITDLDSFYYRVKTDGDQCRWVGPSCTPRCDAGYFVAGIDILYNEDCGGDGNDFDFASQKVYCCKLVN